MYKTNSTYPNLEAELARTGINKNELAKVLKMSQDTLYGRLNGKTKLTLEEARIIKAYVEKRAGQPISFLRLFSISD